MDADDPAFDDGEDHEPSVDRLIRRSRGEEQRWHIRHGPVAQRNLVRMNIRTLGAYPIHRVDAALENYEANGAGAGESVTEEVAREAEQALGTDDQQASEPSTASATAGAGDGGFTNSIGSIDVVDPNAILNGPAAMSGEKQFTVKALMRNTKALR